MCSYGRIQSQSSSGRTPSGRSFKRCSWLKNASAAHARSSATCARNWGCERRRNPSRQISFQMKWGKVENLNAVILLSNMRQEWCVPLAGLRRRQLQDAAPEAGLELFEALPANARGQGRSQEPKPSFWQKFDQQKGKVWQGDLLQKNTELAKKRCHCAARGRPRRVARLSQSGALRGGAAFGTMP